ncbi:hypothetical protein [Saccharopolyspora hattusasensis]|uniref:hypothetical protein n=1 Tax=Saccharopolyspora hattusasensis TaxID=1128679 RepID=UPI003D98EB06
MSGYNISDSNGEIPVSRRKGLPIPPELREAVDASLESKTAKRVAVDSENEANRIVSFLRSLTNREGYQFEQGKERTDDGTIAAVVFLTLDKGKPKRGHKREPAKA